MLSGKVALVTGAAQGIGYAIASALISNGAKVNHKSPINTHVFRNLYPSSGERSRSQ